jgi:predicted Ser/Thr protein kinase
MNCPRCDSPSETQALQEFGGVCPKCLLEFAAEKDAPSFPNLEIIATLGEGGMGVVYKAVQKQLGRTVALKVLSPQLSTDPSFVERFTREAKALASLSHPNIVGIHDSGVHDGVPYLIMEYVEGTSLRKLIAARKLTAEQALQVVPQICDALAYAHAHGVVHRDVKPENILIDREGRVRIADFGLAKLATPEQTRITRTNVVMGTPSYMAPEQIENPSAVDHRADLYSLGVIFYEMLTGELPLGIFKPPSVRAATDRRLDPVVMKSLEKEPEDRYQSADEMKEHVTHLEPKREIRTGPRPVRRTGTSLWLASAILTLIAIAIALEGENRSTVIWTGFAAAVCGLVALSRLGRRRPPDREPGGPNPGRPAIRVVVQDPLNLKKAAIILAIMGGIPLVLSLVLMAFGPERLAGLPLLPAIGFLLLAEIVTLAALVRHAFRRASGGSTGWSVALIVAGMLILAGILSKGRSHPPAVSAPSPPATTAFRLEKAWPKAKELPPGLSYDRIEEGEELFRNEPPREEFRNGVHIIRIGPGKEMLPDLRLIRRATLLGGQVILMGYEFKTEFARKRWEKEKGMSRALPVDGQAPEGCSFFDLGSTELKPTHEAEAAIELLTPLLERKMREAASR